MIGCAAPESGVPPRELKPQGKVLAKARKRSSAEGDYRMRTASVDEDKSEQAFVQSLQQEINVYKAGARYSDVRVLDTDDDGFADGLCVVTGQFFADGRQDVDTTHCRKLPEHTVPMRIPLESALLFVNSLEAE